MGNREWGLETRLEHFPVIPGPPQAEPGIHAVWRPEVGGMDSGFGPAGRPGMTTTRFAIGRSLSPISNHFHPAHIRLQRRRHRDRTVRLLVILKHRDQRPPDGKAGAVQRMDEPRTRRRQGTSAYWASTYSAETAN